MTDTHYKPKIKGCLLEGGGRRKRMRREREDGEDRILLGKGDKSR